MSPDDPNRRALHSVCFPVVARATTELVRLVNEDGVTRAHAQLRFRRDLLWVRKCEYLVRQTHGKEVLREHETLIDTRNLLGSLDHAVDAAQNRASATQLGPDHPLAVEVVLLARDFPVIEVPESLRSVVYAASPGTQSYLHAGEDWMQADEAVLDRWLQTPWQDREEGVDFRVRPRAVYEGVVWSSTRSAEDNAANLAAMRHAVEPPTAQK